MNETAMRLTSTLLALPLLAGLAAPARAETAATVSFAITDAVDPMEVAEDTTVFINGKLVAHFALSADHPFGETQVVIPVADRYDYALCGRITIRVPDGHSETHILDDGATLTEPAGRRLEALATDGFTTFYLGERTPDIAAAIPRDLHKTNVCSIPVS